MRKMIVCSFTALMLLALTAHSPAQAQNPGGDALQKTAAGLRDALLNGTPDELFNKLAPWMRGRVELFDERLPEQLREYKEKMPEKMREEYEKELQKALVEDMADRDPEGKLGVKVYDDVIKLSAAQMYSLEIGQLVLQANADLKDRRAAKWHEVERAIYQAQEELEWDEGETVLRTYGKVGYVNRFMDSLVVTCVADGETWQVVQFKAVIGDWDAVMDDNELMANPLNELEAVAAAEAKRSEAEQLMGSARNQCRVHYSKTAIEPKLLSDTMNGVTLEDAFGGVYFSLRDKVYKKPDMSRGAIVAEPNEDDSLGWGVLYFNYSNGDSDIEWYASEDELERALKDFETAR